MLICAVAVLQAEVEKALSIPPSKQKLMYKGLLKDDALTLQKVKRRSVLQLSPLHAEQLVYYHMLLS
jgi:hypothetical protein